MHGTPPETVFWIAASKTNQVFLKRLLPVLKKTFAGEQRMSFELDDETRQWSRKTVQDHVDQKHALLRSTAQEKTRSDYWINDVNFALLDNVPDPKLDKEDAPEELLNRLLAIANNYHAQ